MLAARTAAPSPIRLNGMLTMTRTGTTNTVGSHRSRHCGSPRNANASTGGTRKKNAEATPDSIPCASACQDVFSQLVVHAATVEPEEALEEPGHSQDRQSEDAETREPAGSECSPEAKREGDDQESVEVRRELVVEPGVVGRLRTDVADVVVGRAELVGLGEVAEHKADDECHRG